MKQWLPYSTNRRVEDKINYREKYQMQKAVDRNSKSSREKRRESV
jgi:hypothetical protein